jgi:hypothetical protein
VSPRRLALLVLGGALISLLAGPAVLDAARRLDARLRGQDPEQALVCAHRQRTGYPCPACGGTTALRAMARLDVPRAARENVVGAYLGACAWLIALAATFSALRGRWLGGRRALAALAIGLVIAIAVHMTLWLRAVPAWAR